MIFIISCGSPEKIITIQQLSDEDFNSISKIISRKREVPMGQKHPLGLFGVALNINQKFKEVRYTVSDIDLSNKEWEQNNYEKLHGKDACATRIFLTDNDNSYGINHICCSSGSDYKSTVDTKISYQAFKDYENGKFNENTMKSTSTKNKNKYEYLRNSSVKEVVSVYLNESQNATKIIESQNGKETGKYIFEYNQKGELEKSSKFNNNKLIREEQFEYNDLGLLVCEEEYFRNEIISWKRYSYTFKIDAAKRLKVEKSCETMKSNSYDWFEGSGAKNGIKTFKENFYFDNRFNWIKKEWIRVNENHKSITKREIIY